MSTKRTRQAIEVYADDPETVFDPDDHADRVRDSMEWEREEERGWW